MVWRLLQASAAGSLEAVAQHVASLSAEGPVLFISTREPASRLAAALDAAGAHAKRVHLLDATGLEAPPRGARYTVDSVPGPHLPELLRVRASRHARAAAQTPHIVYYCANSLAAAVPPAVLEEMTRHAFVEPRAARVDLVLHDTPPLPPAVLDLYLDHIPTRLRLGGRQGS